jgi:hypothetical protein
MKASKSALIVSACVVGMPAGWGVQPAACGPLSGGNTGPSIAKQGEGSRVVL